MTTASPFRERSDVDTWIARLSQRPRHGIDSADPGMVVPPVDDPGYALPNVDISSLPQGSGGVSRAYPISAQGSGLLGLTDDQLTDLLGLAQRTPR